MSQVNSKLDTDRKAVKEKMKAQKLKNFLVLRMQHTMRPKYQSLLQRYFHTWRNKLLWIQGYELKQLELANDILTNELEQVVPAYERLKDDDDYFEHNLNAIKCPDHIARDIRVGKAGGFFDETDSDQEDLGAVGDRATGASARKGRRAGIDGDLSDSLKDKNKLSQSEKSLNKPLKIL